jgi:signal transduction histidine kinase
MRPFGQFLIEKVAWFSVLCLDNYGTISIATAFVVLVIACTLLIVRLKVLNNEDWVLYLGLAFVTFVAQYGLRTVAVWLTHRADPDAGLLERVSQSVCSNGNSFFFFLTAMSLLYCLPRQWYRTPRLLYVLPFAVTAYLGLRQLEPWDRVFDAWLSASSLLLLGYAMFRNSRPRKNKLLSIVNLAGGSLYALLNLAFGLVPVLALCQPLIDAVGRQPGIQGRLSIALMETALDKSAFGLAFGFKVTLFAGAFFLIIRHLLSVMNPVQTGRGEMANIVIGMANSIGSDAAALYIVLPGKESNQIGCFRWSSEEPNLIEESSMHRPSAASSVIGQTLASSEMIESRNWRTDVRFGDSQGWDFTPGMLSFISMPLLYDDANIGIVMLEWKTGGGYVATDVQNMRQIADSVTRSVQAERWLYAINELRKRLQHYNFPDVVGRGDFIGRVAREIHDVLSPSGTFLLFDFGFRPLWATCGPSTRSCDEVETRVSIKQIEDEFHDDFDNGMKFIERPIKLMNVQVGRLVVAVRKKSSADERKIIRNSVSIKRSSAWDSSLAEDQRQLDVIAEFVNDILLDLHGIRFGGICHNLHHTLDSIRFASEELWHQKLIEAAKDAGLSWLTVYPDRLHKSADEEVDHGSPPPIEQIVQSGGTLYGGRRVFQWTPAGGSTQAVLQLPLPLCKETLYAGIERDGFGGELNGDLPWTRLFDRFVDAADSALDRIRAITLETEALEFEMNDLLVHELKTPGAEVQYSVQELEDILLEHQVQDDGLKQTLSDLKQSADRFLGLADSIIKPLPRDKRPVVALSDVRKHVKRSYSGRLTAKEIELEWGDEHDDWLIKVPLHLAYLVIGTLVQNARDAIGKGPGVIKVLTDKVGDNVLLHVDDSGIGILPDIKDDIYKMGVTSKRHGTGRGLPLALRTLNRHNGDLRDEPAPAGFATRFTIEFPLESA